MHFWIDKRSSYGHNRMGHGVISYHNRRIRSKSLVTPQIVRPHPIPTSSHQHAKTHQRNRQVKPDQRITHATPPIQQQSFSQVPMQLNSHHIPVVHSVYPREEVSINVMESENSRNTGVINQWLPIQIICSVILMSLVILRFFFDGSTDMQILSIGSMFIALLCTTAFSILRMRRNRNILWQNENFTESVVEPLSQNPDDDVDVSCDLPPAYHLVINQTPPPSYEKINIL